MLSAELRAEMSELRGELHTDVAGLRAEMHQGFTARTRRLMGYVTALGAVVLAVARLLL